MKTKFNKTSSKYHTQPKFNKRNYRLEKDSKESFSCACLRLSAERRIM